MITNMKGQNAPFAIPYQAIARNASGVIIPGQNIQIKVGVYSGSSSGTLEWEETHAATTDLLGLFKISLGQGISTGGGTLASFSLINWQAALHFVKIQIDYTGGSSYISMGASQLLSVPYAFFSNNSQTSSGVSINDLMDVDTTGIHNGYMLKSTGTQWKPMKDNDKDTVTFAYNVGHSTNSDSTSNALQHAGFADTVLYAYHAGSAASSTNSQNSTNAAHSTYSDTANYATNFLPYSWSVNGNSVSLSSNQLNVVDSNDLIFKTNNSERFHVTSSGKTGIGTATPQSAFDILGNDGLIQVGTFGSGDSTLSYTTGTHMMWYPRRAAFRLGTVTGNQWSNSRIGDYSFAMGYNVMSSGFSSSAIGDSSSVFCLSSISMGNKCFVAVLSGVDDGGALAIGDSCVVTYTRSVAMGYHCISNGGYSFGYRNKTGAGNSFACGNNNNAYPGSCMAMGSYASTNGQLGSFVYADASSNAITAASANYQFIVRASGGTVFYSDPSATNGVTLFPGSGSWASVSDRNKKENFSEVNGEDVLSQLSKIKITSWNYKSQSATIRHIGPMAQDFYKAFKLGESRKKINMVDIDGVTLLALKTLYSRVNFLNSYFDEMKKLKAETKNISEEQESLDKRLDHIQQGILQQ
ncbi:MAG: tail fiber domain-containing protein [Bacteroidia bacterium]